MSTSSAAESPARALPGLALVVLGAVLLSAKGILSKLLYAEGLDSMEVVTIRAVLSLPLFWLWGIYMNGLQGILGADRRAVLGAALAGVFCYYIGGSLDFYALTLIDAGLERVLLYTYPAIIVITLALYRRRLPTLPVTCSLLLTYTGIVLAIGVFEPELWQANAFGAFLVLFCAFTYAGYFFANDLVGQKIGSTVFTVYAMTAATIALVIHFSLTHSPADLSMTQRSGWLFFVLVVFVTVVPLFLLAEGVKQVGAQRAGLLSTVGPASTILLAWIVLGEALRWFQYCGVFLTLCGILVLEWQQKQALPVSDGNTSVF